MSNKKIAKEVEKKATTERRRKEAIKAQLLQRNRENRDQTKEKMLKVSREYSVIPEFDPIRANPYIHSGVSKIVSINPQP